MGNELIQWVLDIIFSKHMVYLAPMLFLFMSAIFADRLIDIVYKAIASKNRWQ